MKLLHIVQYIPNKDSQPFLNNFLITLGILANNTINIKTVSNCNKGRYREHNQTKVHFENRGKIISSNILQENLQLDV